MICLGSTAAQALIRPDFELLKERGLVPDCELAPQVIATVHPAYLLRLPKGPTRDAALNAWHQNLAHCRR